MFKKILGSVSAATSKAPSYEVPDELPSLDPSLNNVLPKIKLPDSIKRYMNNPAFPVDDPSGSVATDAGEFAKDAATGAVADAAAQQTQSQAGEAFAKSFEQADGNSATFLSSLLKDPRFALISVKFLAFGLKKESAVLWAAESATLGYAIAGQKNQENAPQMTVAEEAAVEQARIYAAGGKVSSEEITGLVAETGMDKPGAPTALAASWAQDPPPPEAGDSRALVGEMVSAAVLLSAAMTLPDASKEEPLEVPETAAVQGDITPADFPIVPEDPKDSAEMAAALKPFMDKGLELAATS